MPTFEIDKAKLFAGLEDQFGVDGFKEELAKLKELQAKGFNPFKTVAEGGVGWETYKEGAALLNGIFYHAVVVVEHTAFDAGQVASGAKREALIDFLDEVIKLPFWLVPFERPIYRATIDGIVSTLNRLLGKDWVSKIPKPATEGI